MGKYYISQRGKQVGPWTVEEIVTKLNSKHLEWSDYIYDEKSKEWVVLMQHPQFQQMFKAASLPTPPPERPLAKDVIKLSSEKSWFILRGQNKHGPFSYLELVKLLQEKKLFEFDFLWCPHWASWKRVAETEEFGPEHIKALRDSGALEVTEIFHRRRHNRVEYGASLVVHNNKSVWKGESLEISAGGAGIAIHNNDLHPGQTLFLHFKAGDGVPSFNAICSIVSKTQVKGEKNLYKYGVKFTNISQDVQIAIKRFTDKAA